MKLQNLKVVMKITIKTEMMIECKVRNENLNFELIPKTVWDV